MDDHQLCPESGPDSAPASALSKARISPLAVSDLAAVAHLHEIVFGPGRFTRTAYRVREGAPEISSACSKVVIDGRLAGAVQMTWVRVGGAARGMLLGPLVVANAHAAQGHGKALVATACEKAGALGAEFVILVGDLEYYEKSGFKRVPARAIALPGPVDPGRLLIRMMSTDKPLPTGALRAATRYDIEDNK